MKHDVSLMKSILGKNFTKRNRFTRQCIGESIITLMQSKVFEEITISDIVKKAGVSRMTFYHDAVHIRHAFLFFDQYAFFFLTLANANLHSLMLHAIDEYITKLVAPVYPHSAYELHYYGGALLNVFLKWEAEGKKESVDEIVQVICHCSNINR